VYIGIIAIIIIIMSYCSVMDTPLNLSTCRKTDVFSTLPEQKLKHFQAGYTVWTNTTFKNEKLSEQSTSVPVTVQSGDWSETSTTLNSDKSVSPSSSPLAERSFGPFTLSSVKHRGPKHPVPDEKKDDRYFKRRRRNNEAAKRSRLARKERQDSELNRIALIEVENAALRSQMLSLRAEYETLAQLILLRRRELIDGFGFTEQEKLSNKSIHHEEGMNQNEFV
jgi:hypothetical protein